MKKHIIYCILFCISFVTFSQTETDTTIENTEDSWEFDVTPYAWFAGLNADISFLEQTVPVSAEFKDVLDNLSIGALMHAEVKKGQWFIMGDIVYMKITKDGNIDALNIDAKLEIEQTVAELAVGYNLIKLQDGWLFIDGFAGMRYFGIDNNIKVGSQELLDKTINTNDPFLGVRFRTVSDKWVNSARIDVGGFGIGSEISWKFNLFTGYKFSKLFSLYFGVQAYGIDYEKNDFKLNLNSAGLATGLNFHF